MAVIAYTPTTADLPVGGVWTLVVAASDADGVAAVTAPTFTVTLPGGTTTAPAATLLSSGVWRATYVPAAAGRYTARVVSTGNGAVDFVATVSGATLTADMPDLDELRDYLKIEIGDTSRDDDITSALAAETDAQRSVCRVPAAYPNDLREALHRRVARNLALRALPLAVLRGDAEAGNTILPGRDPEVRRLEAPWRKRKMG